MVAINANVNSSLGWLPFTTADALSLAPGYYTVDSENVDVGGLHFTGTRTTTAPNGRWAVRGFAASTAASHTAGATLTRYYPEAPGGGGAGGVTVDNTVDAPEEVTTIVAAGATVGSGMATLAEGGGVVTVLEMTVTLTDAQIKALPTTPVTLVPAPGAGRALQVVSVFMSQNFVAGYVVSVATLVFADDSPDTTRRATYDATADFAEADARAAQLRVPATDALTGFVAAWDNTPLVLFDSDNGDDFTGGDAANTLKITIWYAVVDL